MAFSLFSILVFIGIGAAITYLVKYLARQGSNVRPLPPGPKGLPLVGNLIDMPKPGEIEYQHWLKHKDVYGPISSLTILGQTIVIINDGQIALELLRDKAATTAGRPHSEFASKLAGYAQGVGMQNNMNDMKKHRTNMAKILGSAKSLKVANVVQEEESAHLILKLLDSPEKLFEHIKIEAGAVILKLTYGYSVNQHGKDHLVDIAGQMMQDFSEAFIPGRWMVDILPFLQYLPDWLPGTSFKRTARRMNATWLQCTNEPYAFVKQQMLTNKHKTSFLSQALEIFGDGPDMQDIHKFSAVSMYAAGADTTVASLMVFFLAMMLFPDVLNKAQEELDRVVGDRLPNSSDRDNLPYIWAIVLEIHRWHPVGPLGIPHASIKEDFVRGYRIPKGSIIMTNIWGITHDPAMYSDPSIFRPERFIETPKHEAEPDPRTYTFGFGRRVCPGKLLADNALFVTVAQTLSVFDVKKPVDRNGRVVEPKAEFEAGLVSHPMPYKTSIKPRSAEHEKRIRALEKVYPWEQSDAKELENSTM